MAVANTPGFIEYTGNGVTTTFAYPFKIFVTTDLVVKLAGVTQTTGFSVTGAGSDTGGSVIFTTAPASAAAVGLYRVLPVVRTTDYQQSGDFYQETVDNDQDYQTILIQDLDSRALKVPIAEMRPNDVPSIDARAGRFLSFDANGHPVAVFPTTDAVATAYSAEFGYTTATATAGQTVFTGLTYVAGTQNLAVYRNGQRLFAPTDYVEDAPTGITLVTGASAGDIFTFLVGGDVAPAGDLNFLGFIQAGTGAITRSAQDKMREHISVVDFGADTTGTLSSVNAFQAAITSTTDGKVQVIHVPRGTYLGDMTTLTYGSRVVIFQEEGGVTYSTAAPTAKRMFYTVGATAEAYMYGQYRITFTPAGTAAEPQPLRIDRAVSYTGGTALNPSALSVKTNITSDNGTKENCAIFETDDNAATVQNKSRTAMMASARRKVTGNNSNIITGNLIAEDQSARKSSINNGSMVALEVNVNASGPDDATGGRRFGIDVVSLEYQASADGATTMQGGVRVRNSGSTYSAANTWNYGFLVEPDSTNGGVTHAFAVQGGSPTDVFISRVDNAAVVDVGTNLNTGNLVTSQNTGKDSAGTLIPYSQIKTAVVANTAGAATARIDLTTRQAGTLIAEVGISNGTRLGAPTGGFKGTGTLNVAGDIYKNNTAYTNPDYVFELHYTGKIEQFANKDGAKDYDGIMPLDWLREYTRDNLRLPGISDEPMGMFERGDKVLEKLEELTLYILELHERIKTLESK